MSDIPGSLVISSAMSAASLLLDMYMLSLSLDIDECTVSNPCRNNGTCLNKNGSYVCECTEGFMGKHCKEGNSLINLATSS